MKATQIKYSLFLLSILLVPLLGTAQNRDPYHNRLILAPNEGTEIQQITIYDQTVLREIRTFIKEFSDSSTLFKEGFGFLTLDNFVKKGFAPIPAQSLDNHDKDVVLTFRMKAASYTLHPVGYVSVHPYDFHFPAYYTKVDNRLVLIFENNIEQISVFSRNSKEKLAEEVSNTLRKSLDPDFEFLSPITLKVFKISEEDRKKMDKDDIMSTAHEMYGFNPFAYRTVFAHLDGNITYKHGADAFYGISSESNK